MRSPDLGLWGVESYGGFGDKGGKDFGDEG